VLIITADRAQLGRREKDMRLSDSAVLGNTTTCAVGREDMPSSPPFVVDPSLCWGDVAWLRSITRMKLVIKGIQCGEVHHIHTMNSPVVCFNCAYCIYSWTCSSFVTHAYA